MELSIPGINQFEKEKLSSLSNRTNKKISLNVIEIPTFLHQIYCGEIILITSPSKSSRSPCLTATRSVLDTLIPNERSRLTAYASRFVNVLFASRAA